MKIEEYIEKKCQACQVYNEICCHHENLGDISESAINRCEEFNLFRHK
jgi:phage FluMu protein Com